MSQCVKSEFNSSGIKFFKNGGIELKTLGVLGNTRISSDKLVKNSDGDLLIIFNHIGTHDDVALCAKGFKNSVLLDLNEQLHDFSQMVDIVGNQMNVTIQPHHDGDF